MGMYVDWDFLSQKQRRRVLEQPEMYPDQPGRVECIETHLSWVILTRQFAYKIRKPIRYGKLNYTTLRLRFEDAAEEIKQNRRLAEDLYYGIFPLTYSEKEGFKAEGSGSIVEWMIKMRRLPADCMFDYKIKNETLTEEDVRSVADRLAFFYLHQHPTISGGEEYLRRLKVEIQLNYQALSGSRCGFSLDLLSGLKRIQLDFLFLRRQLLTERAERGHIIDGHGDLRPEHICVEPERTPTIFDCLQFDPDLRKLDSIDELSFLSLECERIGAPQVEALVFNRYSEITNDRSPEVLRFFYKIYRACTWARLASERTLELDQNLWNKWIDRANEYLELAEENAEKTKAFMELKASR
jgi:aminoglycoside phosphotransferase family enzyme